MAAHAEAIEAPTTFIRKYIFSIDHKVIGIQYLLLAMSAVIMSTSTGATTAASQSASTV